MDINKVFKRNKKWVKDKLEIDSNYFTELAKGQIPKILYIGCSDSRVVPEEILGFGIGKVFVHRNIANLIPLDDNNSQAVVNFAVEHLHVEHIIVCGHYSCGGVKAAMSSKDYGVMNPWLKNIKDVYHSYDDELKDIKSYDERYNRLVELNVIEQCHNLMKVEEVKSAVISNKIKIHGWVFDMNNGELIELDIEQWMNNNDL